MPNSITRELELHLLFDAKSVLDLLNTKADYRWLRKMLYDLQAMVISIQKKDGIWPESWSLVSYIGETLVDAERKPGQLKAKLKKIVLSPGAVKWMSENMKIIMDIKVLEKIFLLENEVSRAVARWFLSHATSQNHGINSVLDAVGCNTETSKEIKRRISQLENDSEILEALGITLGANVNSKRIAGVSFKK